MYPWYTVGNNSHKFSALKIFILYLSQREKLRKRNSTEVFVFVFQIEF